MSPLLDTVRINSCSYVIIRLLLILYTNAAMFKEYSMRQRYRQQLYIQQRLLGLIPTRVFPCEGHIFMGKYLSLSLHIGYGRVKTDFPALPRKSLQRYATCSTKSMHMVRAK